MCSHRLLRHDSFENVRNYLVVLSNTAKARTINAFDPYCTASKHRDGSDVGAAPSEIEAVLPDGGTKRIGVRSKPRGMSKVTRNFFASSIPSHAGTRKLVELQPKTLDEAGQSDAFSYRHRFDDQGIDCQCDVIAVSGKRKTTVGMLSKIVCGYFHSKTSMPFLRGIFRSSNSKPRSG